jgi:hypothetical protein
VSRISAAVLVHTNGFACKHWESAIQSCPLRVSSKDEHMGAHRVGRTMGSRLRNRNGWAVPAWLGLAGLVAGVSVLVLPSANAAAAPASAAGRAQAQAPSRRMTLAQAPAALQAAARQALSGTATGAAVTTLSPTPPAPGDSFGTSIAISGATALIGAPGVNGNRGAVYIFVRCGKTWRHQATLYDRRNRAGDSFGSAVAVSSTAAGTFALIGAQGQGVPERAFVYQRSGTAWHLQAKLAGPSGQFFDAALQFGLAVAITSTTAVVSTATPQFYSLGGIYVFVRSGTTWHLQAILRNPTGGDQGNFGGSLAISGSTIVADASNLGCAFVFTRSGQEWTTQATLNASGEVAHCVLPVSGDGLGSSVAISGSTVVIGADGSLRGVAYVFTRSGTTWSRQARLADPYRAGYDWFGQAVAISGTRVLVGAPFRSASHCGTAYEYTRSGQTWRERAKMVNPGCSGGDGFGWSLAISGTTAMIGAPGEDKSAGAVYQEALP